MKDQLILLIGENMVTRLNMVAQIVLYFAGAVGFYEARNYRFVSAVLSRIAFLKRFFFHSRVVTVVENLKTGERDSWTRSATGLLAFTGELQPSGTIIKNSESNEAFVIIEERREDLANRFYFVASAVALIILIVIGNGIVYWLLLPFREFLKAFTVWGDLNFSRSALLIPLLSFWYFIIGIVFLGLV
jgi:hypothetical protein